VTCLASIGFSEIHGERCAFAVLQDVTGQRAALEALRLREAESRAMFELAPIGVAQTDPKSGRFLRVNRKLCEITGYEANELLEMDVHALNHPDDATRHAEFWGALVRGEASGYHLEKRYLRKDARVAWVSVNVTALLDPSGKPERFFSTIEDITERKADQATLELHRAAFRAAANGILITDTAGVIEQANDAVCKLSGYDVSELVGSTPRRFRSGRHPAEFYRGMWDTIRAGQVWRGEIVNQRKDGSLYCEDETITPVRCAGGDVSHYVAIIQDITDRKRAEAALVEAEEQQRMALVAANMGTWKHDIARRTMHLDVRAMAMFGFDRPEIPTEEFIGRTHPDEHAQLRQAIARSHDPAGDGRHSGEIRVVLPTGELRWLSVSVQVRFEGDGESRHAVSTVATCRDISDTKLAEQRQRDTENQLRAAQKLEAVGRLAGGVAHDFNNLLSVILSYAEVASAGVTSDDALKSDLHEIVRAAQRGEGLTAQLLAFSRRQVWRPKAIDLEALIGGIQKMLRRLIGEDVQLEVVSSGNLFQTRADSGQLEQVLMNLAVNARDAMPDGGRLTIRMRNVAVDPAKAAELGVDSGDFVEIAVEDTGIGMDDDTIAHVFEPFFTTKGVGKGTGLGLSTVYGIVRQCGGAVVAASAPGAGATFRLFLKRAESVVESAPPSAPRAPYSSARETILVVEDEPALREVVRRVLSAAGYTVLAAASPEEALSVGKIHGGDVLLVLTDVIMPGMNGSVLVQRLLPMCPRARIVFMSGYTDDTIERLDVLGHDFLRKPFTGSLLVQKVRGALAGAAVA
jgi:PAS domain S-box-containing protein